MARKDCLKKFSRIKEDIECAWNIIVSAYDANRIDIVYGSYLENLVNQKESIEHHLSQSRLFKFIFPVLYLSNQSALPYELVLPSSIQIEVP